MRWLRVSMGSECQMSMGGSPVIAKASIGSDMLLRARSEISSMGTFDGNGYPEVRNRSGYVDTIQRFMGIVAKRGGIDEQPDQVWVAIREGSDEDGNPMPPRYVIVIEDEERIMDLPRTLSVIMLFRPTREMESLSVISDEGITWSADSQMNTSHNNRTVYYMGFLSLMALKTKDFDKEPMPEQEMSADELMSDAIGTVPSQISSIPEIGGDDADDGEDGNAPDGDAEPYAGTWHNGKTKEQEDAQESAVMSDDLMTTFEDLANVSDA